MKSTTTLRPANPPFLLTSAAHAFTPADYPQRDREQLRCSVGDDSNVKGRRRYPDFRYLIGRCGSGWTTLVLSPERPPEQPLGKLRR